MILAATNGVQAGAIGKVRIPLGEGIEGWVGRRLEPVMLKDFHATRGSGTSRASLRRLYSRSTVCRSMCIQTAPWSGVMEVLYRKTKNFTDEEINFFTTLSGIISTTIQNEQMQVELRKMNMELEQWVTEKTEELRASEERYRILVENACESIFLLAENGDVVFANEQAARLTGYARSMTSCTRICSSFSSDPCGNPKNSVGRCAGPSERQAGRISKS